MLCAICSAADPQADTAATDTKTTRSTKTTHKSNSAKTPKEKLAPSATELPQVTVSDQLLENAPTGAGGAPEWTRERRFSTTRVYLQQGPGEFGFEQWYRGRYYKDGTAQNKFKEELEIGLPFRLQLDLYANWTTDEHRYTVQDEVAVEVRWALADWGKLPLNPTLYGEYSFVHDDSDVVELKLLLGDNFGPRWHYGLNFSIEQQVGGAHSTELLAAQGISYTLIDQKLSVGLEMEFIHTSETGNRHDPSVEFNIGPSIQWRPTSNTHLDIVPLIGTTKDSPHAEVFLIFGIDFGPGASKSSGDGKGSVETNNPARYTPASLGGR